MQTIEFWAAYSNFATDYAYLMQYAGSGNGWAIFLPGGNNLDYVTYGPARHDMADLGFVPGDGKWHHIAFVSANGSKTAIIDGVVRKTVTVPSDYQFGAAQSTFAVGAGPGGNNACSLHISELRIWNVARTEQQIAANMYSQLVGNEAGLKGLWAFDDGSGNVAVNKAGGSAFDLSGTVWKTDNFPLVPETYTPPPSTECVTQADLNNGFAQWLSSTDGTHSDSAPLLNRTKLAEVMAYLTGMGLSYATVETLLGNALDNLDNEIANRIALVVGTQAPPPGFTGQTLTMLATGLALARADILARIDTRGAEGITATGAATTAVEAAVLAATGEVLTAIADIPPGADPTDLEPVLTALSTGIADIIGRIGLLETDAVAAINLYTGGQIADTLLALGAAKLAIETQIGPHELDLHAHISAVQTHLDTELDNAAIALDEAISTHGDGAVLAVNNARNVVTSAITTGTEVVTSAIDDRSDQIDTALATNQTAALTAIGTNEANTQANIVAARDNLRLHVTGEVDEAQSAIVSNTNGATLAIMAAIAAATATTNAIQTAVTSTAAVASTLLSKIDSALSIVENLLGIINQVKDLLENPATVAPALELVGQTTFTSMIDWDVAADVYEIDINSFPGVRSKVDLGDEYYIPRAAWCAYKIGERYVRGVPLEFTKQVVTPGNPLISGLLVFPRAGTTGAIRAFRYVAP